MLMIFEFCDLLNNSIDTNSAQFTHAFEISSESELMKQQCYYNPLMNI